jgi:hypothetical protein
LRHLAWRPSGWTELSAAGTVVAGRRQQFVLHATPEFAPSADSARVVSGLVSCVATDQICQLCAVLHGGGLAAT